MAPLLFTSENKTPILTGSPAARAHHALVYDIKSEAVFMTGGSTPLEGGQRFEFFNDTWKYNGKEWTNLGESGTKRSGVALAYNSKEDIIYSFGGYSGDSSLSELRKYADQKWVTVSNLNGLTAAEPGMAYDSKRDKLIVFGGSAGRGMVNEATWEWNGTSWSKFGGNGPAGRQAFAMIYDSKRKVTVLFGGMGRTPKEIFGDTWEYDGASWKKIDINGPSPRISMGYAYDEKRGMFLLFGGASASGFEKDTWGFDGKTWTKLSDTGPSPRVMGYMTYDKKRDRTVLFGGRISWPHDVNDTWEWDGKEWTEIK